MYFIVTFIYVDHSGANPSFISFQSQDIHPTQWLYLHSLNEASSWELCQFFVNLLHSEMLIIVTTVSWVVQEVYVGRSIARLCWWSYVDIHWLTSGILSRDPYQNNYLKLTCFSKWLLLIRSVATIANLWTPFLKISCAKCATLLLENQTSPVAVETTSATPVSPKCSKTRSHALSQHVRNPSSLSPWTRDFRRRY